MIDNNLITPQRLVKGDRIAILSPATEIKPDYVEGAVDRLSALGFEPVVMPHAIGCTSGSYSSCFESRLADFSAALTDKSIKAILCARGGYGAVHLIDKIDVATLRQNVKWIIGYSDVSALHAMMLHAGIRSMHAPMAKHLSIEPADDCSVVSMLDVLGGKREISYSLAAESDNICGRAVGMLRGGNLAVLNGLAGSDFDILKIESGENVVLFVEDIGEAIYASERMFYNLKLRGVLDRVRALIVGQFTESRADRNYDSTRQMIGSLLSRFNLQHLPTVFNFPVGHVTANMPMIEGAEAELDISERGTRLTMKF